MTERCEICKYWKRNEPTEMIPRPLLGNCRRYPRFVSAVGRKRVSTYDSDWCGEYKENDK